MSQEEKIKNIWQDIFLYFRQGITGPLVLQEVGANEEVIGELTQEEQIILAATQHLDQRGTPLLKEGDADENDEFFLHKINDTLNDLIFTSIIYRLKDKMALAGSGKIAVRKGGLIVVVKSEQAEEDVQKKMLEALLGFAQKKQGRIN